MIKKAIINKITLVTEDGEVVDIEYISNGKCKLSNTTYVNDEDLDYINELVTYVKNQ